MKVKLKQITWTNKTFFNQLLQLYLLLTKNVDQIALLSCITPLFI